MGLINNKAKLTGHKYALKQHEKRKRDYIEAGKQKLREALGDNYPQLKRRTP